jgi:LacI family transcriptional regulator
MRKVTMQTIADELGVSRVTVWKVFNNQAGVSDSLKAAVLNKAEALGYFKGVNELNTASIPKNIALVVSRPESSTFWTGIIHSMAEEFSKNNANLIYTSIDPIYSDGFTLPIGLRNGSCDLAVVLNVYDVEIVKRINAISIPKVFLDTVPELTSADITGDLLLIEGYHTTYNITESVVKQGAKTIGFIGDIHYAWTNADRYKGYNQCLSDNKIEIRKEFCMTDRIDIFSYKQTLYDYLDSLTELPEAFVCASDFIAHFVHFYLTEHPERIPNGMIVTGFDASEEYANVEGLITTADACIDLLGKRLAQQSLYRIATQDAPFELTYIRPKIMYRESRITV